MQSEYYTSSNGFPHTTTNSQQQQSSIQGPGNRRSFRFSRRTERLDWRKIAAVDVDRIKADADWSVLQQNIQHVTYCNIDQELDLRSVDSTFVKLFKLAQMIIEYLMISQEHLGSVVSTLEQKLAKMVEAHSNVTMKISKQTEELKQVKQENKRRKKMLASQQSFIQSNENNYHKCLYCPKAFVHVGYLQSHVERKHPESGSSIQSKFKQISEKQEIELNELKDKLKMTQHQLEEEKKNYQEKVAEKVAFENSKQEEAQIRQLDAIRQEQMEAQKHEINSLRDMFMTELKEINAKYSESQHALVELQQRHGKASMLGTLQDDDDIAEYKTKLDEQQEEFDQLKKQLEEVNLMKSSMHKEMKKQEKNWKEKNKEVKELYRNKINDLERALEDAQTMMDLEREGSKDEIKNRYEQQMLSMKKKSKQQEKELKVKEAEITQLQKKMKQAVDQVQTLKVEVEASRGKRSKMSQPKDIERHTLSPPPVINTQAPSETEDETEDDDDSAAEDALDSPELLGTTLEDSMLATQDDEDDESTAVSLQQKKQRMTLDSHPNRTRILDGMKLTLDNELTKNLQKKGVGKNVEGISSHSLENKLQNLKRERQQLAKKYPKFYDIREKCRRELDEMTKNQRKGKKSSMSRPKSTVSLPPRSPSPIAKYNPRLSNTASLPRTKPLDSHGMYGVPKTKHTAPPVVSRSMQPPPVAPRTSDVGGSNSVPQDRRVLEESFSSEDEDKITSMDGDDWDSDEVSELNEISPSKTETVGGKSRPKSAVRQSPSPQFIQRGQNVNQLARSIEFQLSGRKGNTKPVGGVDMSGTAGADRLGPPVTGDASRTPSPQIPTIPDKFDSDDEDSFLLSSIEESEKVVPKSKPQAAPRTGQFNGGKKQMGDTDISSNTFGTSMWGSSSKGGDKVSTHGEGSTAKSSLVSVTDWDDDDDDDLGLSDL
ncbi:uncharacterized protein [Antedon mediterranea]|uniref:uncharacterized protein isoform X2 n=1 Tax=Antedon mediterranea TaxID=105859 RepID=UPI003AF4C506